MKLDLRNLLAGECRVLPIDFSLVPAASADPVSSLYHVTFTEPLHVHGEVVNNAGYMRMTLALSVSFTAQCARCLSPVSDLFSFRVERTVVPSGMLQNIKEDAADDYAVTHNGFLDMDEELLELLELEFPTKFLCREDCKGLCPKCGKNLNDGPCGCPEKEIDPRMLPLQKLLEELEAKEAKEKNEPQNS